MSERNLRLVRKISGVGILFLVGWIATDIVRYYL